MKRFHVRLSASDLPRSIRSHPGPFVTERTVVKSDHAKWMLDDPCLNFAISTRESRMGVNHPGLQVDPDDERAGLEVRLRSAGFHTIDESKTT